MKKITSVTVMGLLFICNIISAQNTSSSDPFEVQSRAYKLALKNYDLQTATVALYSMLAMKPERTDLNDSIALLYFAGERYAQAYLIGESILKAQPNRTDMLELVAVSKQNLGMVKEALADYETLFDKGKSMYYLYQMATLQYQLKRYGECNASLDQIIASPDADKQKVTIRLQSGSQEVPMKAAAFNVKGICAMDMNESGAAKDNFEKALQAYPDFTLAKSNIEALQKRGEQYSPSKNNSSKGK